VQPNVALLFAFARKLDNYWSCWRWGGLKEALEGVLVANVELVLEVAILYFSGIGKSAS
jgi:hypothetical protein